MNWIFLSPHLDDAAYSCGGLIWELTNSGQQVEIWTLFAGDPDPDSLSNLAKALHASWGLDENAYQVRREEDLAACRILGAQPRHFDYLDCIYRQDQSGNHLYPSPEAIFAGLDASEENLIDRIGAEIEADLPAGAQIVAPLGIGNHVDHEIVRKAASRLQAAPIYYQDFPYVSDDECQEILAFLDSSDEWLAEVHPLTGPGLEKWYDSSQSYASQLSVFWADERALKAEILDYSAKTGGLQLWKTLPED